MAYDLWDDIPEVTEQHEAAKSKRPQPLDAQPTQQRMRGQIKPAERRNISPSERKVRHQQARQAQNPKTAKISDWSTEDLLSAYKGISPDASEQTSSLKDQYAEVLRSRGVDLSTMPVDYWDEDFGPNSGYVPPASTPSHQNWFQRHFTSTTHQKEITMDSSTFAHEEAALLQRMASARTAFEQEQARTDLDNLRNARRDSIAMDGSLDYDAALSHTAGLLSSVDSEGLAPLSRAQSSLGRTASAIVREGSGDWLDDIETMQTVSAVDRDHSMRTEATLWYADLHPVLKEDREEFARQARSACAHVAAPYMDEAPQAAAAFYDAVNHLHTHAGYQPLQTAAAWGQDPFDNSQGFVQDGDHGFGSGSSLPVGVSPSKAPQTADGLVNGGGTTLDSASGLPDQKSTEDGKAPSLQHGSAPDTGTSPGDGSNPIAEDSSLDKSTQPGPDNWMKIDGYPSGGHKAGSLDDLLGGRRITSANDWSQPTEHTAGEYAGGSPKHGDTATCHKGDGPIQFFSGEWMHLKDGHTGDSHNDVYPASRKKADNSPTDYSNASGHPDPQAPEAYGDAPSMDHGTAPESDTSANAGQVDGTPSGDLDKAKTEQNPDYVNTGGNASGNPASGGPMAGTPTASLRGVASHLAQMEVSSNARTFAEALSKVTSLDQSFAGVTGHQMLAFLQSDATVPPQVKDALAGAVVPPFAREAEYGRPPQGNPDLGWIEPKKTDPDHKRYRDLFPNGVPLHGDLSPEQQRWLDNKQHDSSVEGSKTAADRDLSDAELGVLLAQQAQLKHEFDVAFAALKAAGVEYDANDPIAQRYREASSAVNHVNRKLDYYIATGRVKSGPGFEGYYLASKTADLSWTGTEWVPADKGGEFKMTDPDTGNVAPETYERAEEAYNQNDQDWFDSLPTATLVDMWALCTDIEKCPAWDDEVYDALAARGHFGSRQRTAAEGEIMPPGSCNVYAKDSQNRPGLINVRQVWSPTSAQTVYSGYDYLKAMAVATAAVEKAKTGEWATECKNARVFDSTQTTGTERPQQGLTSSLLFHLGAGTPPMPASGKYDKVEDAVKHLNQSGMGKKPNGANVTGVAFLMGIDTEKAKRQIEHAISSGKIVRAAPAGKNLFHPDHAPAAKGSAKTALSATDVVGYTADADTYCVPCTHRIYGDDNMGANPVYDGEGNEVHPIFGSDEGWEGEVCGSCGRTLGDVGVTAARGNTFSIEDAKNDDGEWLMSPEQIRSEMAADSYPDEDPYDDDDRYGSLHTASRPLHEIADEISRDWRNVEFSAKPYLEAMRYLNTMDDNYGADKAKWIVAYFLSNSAKWKGETAKRIKAELRAMQKSGSIKQAVHLNNVGIEGPGVGSGTTADGTKVRFHLSPSDEAALKSVLYSDLAVNFSGVDVTPDEIITEQGGGNSMTGPSRTGSGVGNTGFDGRWVHTKALQPDDWKDASYKDPEGNKKDGYVWMAYNDANVKSSVLANIAAAFSS